MASADALALDISADTLALHQAGKASLLRPFVRDDLPAVIEELLIGLPTKAGVQVCVNACHSRLFMLPFADALSSEARWQGYARSRFEELFGDSADGWQLRVVPERPGRARLVAALPVVLVGALKQSLGARLRGVTIDALRRLDALRLQQVGYSGALADVGPQHVLIALLVDGQVRRLRLRRMAPRQDELLSVLRVEWAALGREGNLPALAIGPGNVYDAHSLQELQGMAERVLRLD